ncbi:hypothetical protein ECG_03550 [Echinococcus granulosus]|uniref:Expressed conserved protein n=1 Tax=Echinococcus granulosus TaxID=6210 RepID=A0A068X0K6_ECHGR|nr:hypothetical protein ECG_03550 [Echinococcus granulosus]CDS23498.1 hypothetical protein EgrG_000718900 [Echinococcus granulosus]
MRQVALSLLLLLEAASLHAESSDFEPMFQHFLTLKEATFREMLERENDIAELMADVSDGFSPPDFMDGLICYTCDDCEKELEIHESSAICNECFTKVLSDGQIIRGCNVESRTACTTGHKARISCCKSDYCNGAGKLRVFSTCLLILGLTAVNRLL